MQPVRGWASSHSYTHPYLHHQGQLYPDEVQSPLFHVLQLAREGQFTHSHNPGASSPDCFSWQGVRKRRSPPQPPRLPYSRRMAGPVLSGSHSQGWLSWAHHQGQFYWAAQGRYRAHSAKCCSWQGAGPLLLSRPCGRLSQLPQVVRVEEGEDITSDPYHLTAER